jgi:hypothetical protein
MPKKKPRKRPEHRVKKPGRPAVYVWVIECDDPRCAGTHAALKAPPGWA